MSDKKNEGNRIVTSVSILAYGSLIVDPGCEINAVISHKPQGVKTPFNVEFARSSSSRGGAPTLVPVQERGAPVKAVILVLKEQVTVKEAKDMLYRREIHQVCSEESYNPCCSPGPNTVCIKELKDFAGIATTIYTAIEPNIKERTSNQLARLAIQSVGKTEKGRDGISYLINAKSAGVETPLMKEYEKEILRQTKTANLEAALGRLQLSQRDPNIGHR